MDSKKGANMVKTIKINGMSCHHCVMAVTRALDEIEGIKDVQVSLEKGEAAFDEEKPVDMAIIREKIEKAGYSLGE
jgi:copper chaperone